MNPSHSQLERPPIVELVLGVQFAPLSSFTSGHLGWFWKRYLGTEWTLAADAPPLGERFEMFDEQKRWPFAGLEWRSESPAVVSPRLKISNEARDRLIQIQATRFHYNWQKKNGSYPRYGIVYQEFERTLNQFRTFVEEAELGKLIPNQWELAYVDRLPQGELWQTAADWYKVLPGLFPPASSLDLNLENVASEWNYEIPHRRGRLYVNVGLARSGEKKELALMLQMTARGPIGKEGAELKRGLDLGHEVAVQTFLKLTSAQAQEHWGLMP